MNNNRNFKNSRLIAEIDPRGEFTRGSGTPLLQLLVKEGIFKRGLLEDERSFSILDPSGFAKIVKLVKALVPYVSRLNEQYIHNNLVLENIIVVEGRAYIKGWSRLKHIQDMYRVRADNERQKLIEYGVKRDRVDDLLESYKPKLMDDVLQTDLATLVNEIDDIINSKWGRVYLKKYLRWSRLYGNSDGFTCDRLRAIADLPA